jgi:hypothetical protein
VPESRANCECGSDCSGGRRENAHWQVVDKSRPKRTPVFTRQIGVRTKPLARRTLRVRHCEHTAAAPHENQLSPLVEGSRESAQTLASSRRKVDSNPIASRARRKRHRLHSNGSIESDAANSPRRLTPMHSCAASLPIESYRLAGLKRARRWGYGAGAGHGSR